MNLIIRKEDLNSQGFWLFLLLSFHWIVSERCSPSSRISVQQFYGIVDIVDKVSFGSHQCLKRKWIKKSGDQEVSQRHTRGESVESISHRSRSTQGNLLWLWNLGQISPEVQKTGTSGSRKRIYVVKNFKRYSNQFPITCNFRKTGTFWVSEQCKVFLIKRKGTAFIEELLLV